MKNVTLNSRLIHVFNFKNPGETLDFELKPISACLADGLIVLDANVLLLPLMTGALTLSAIETVYKKLILDNKLYIPTHALREYLANRPTKIKELIDQLMKKKSHEYVSSISPLMQKSSTFKELTDAEKLLKDEAKKVSKVIEKVIEEIKNWETNDPVSLMYREVKLSKRLLPDPLNLESEKEIKEFLEENDVRVENKIPPGFKDAKKTENDIGDFLIWKSILKLGEQNKGQNLTFVSGEIKTDWVYRSANQTLHVREELIEEYRNASDGGSLHLIDFSTFLKEFKVSDDVVDEVRTNEVFASINFIEEDNISTSQSVISDLKWEDFARYSNELVGVWLKASDGEITKVEGNSVHYTAEYGPKMYLTHIRPLRHVEHVAKRVHEIQKILSLEKRIYDLVTSKEIESLIVFVCENLNDARYVAKFISDGSWNSTSNIAAGYLLDHKFVQVH